MLFDTTLTIKNATINLAVKEQLEQDKIVVDIVYVFFLSYLFPFQYLYIYGTFQSQGAIYGLNRKKNCGGHCVRNIYPREKAKYVPER